MALPVKEYLTAYNGASAFLWFAVFARLAILWPLVSAQFVVEGLGDFTKWVQTLAVLELVHALAGFVRSPVVTTAMQIASRLFLVWGVVWMFPDAATSTPYCTMVLAWSITEVIRYSYYAVNLSKDGVVPRWLVWLRYNTFYVLYPLGAGSEMVVTFLALDDAAKFSPLYALAFKIILLIYIPGFYVMYTHMIKQRRRVLKNIGKRKAPVKQE